MLRSAAAAWVGPAGSRELLRGVDVELVDGRVGEIGAAAPARRGEREVDASGWLVLPGFVNAHHHLSQHLTRACSVGGDLIDWLTELYPRWSRMDAELAYAGARAGIAELLLSGVTTVSDFTYFYPRGQARIFDAQVAAAASLGCRFHPIRGGLAELEAAVGDRLDDRIDAALESRDELLAEIERTVAAHHDPSPEARCRVGAGLTEKAYHDPGLMTEMVELAERDDLRLHTHLHPRADERELARTGAHEGAVEYLRETGWWSERLWVAHGTQLLPGELDSMAKHRVGLCTCPSSNARFGMPIAPAQELHLLGGHVAVGVDGAASNDAGDFVAECRLTWQMQRVRSGSGPSGGGPSIAEVLEWGTAGGAAVLGWPEIGSLAPGKLADVACFDLSALDYAGAEDPLDAILLCGIGRRPAFVAVAGEPVVEEGRLLSADEAEIAREAHLAASRLAGSAA